MFLLSFFIAIRAICLVGNCSVSVRLQHQVKLQCVSIVKTVNKRKYKSAYPLVRMEMYSCC